MHRYFSEERRYIWPIISKEMPTIKGKNANQNRKEVLFHIQSIGKNEKAWQHLALDPSHFSTHGPGRFKLVHPFWEKFGFVLWNRAHGCYPTQQFHSEVCAQKKCLHMYIRPGTTQLITVLFTVSRVFDQLKWLVMRGCLDKLWGAHIIKCYRGAKTNERQQHATISAS